MKFAALALMVATTSAVTLHPWVKKEDTESFFGEKPKTYVWEKKLTKQTQGKPKTQEEIDASWDGDLGFSINMGGEKFDTKMKYDNQDKFQVQSIIDYYDTHELKEPWKH